ncbi:MAG: ACT domain-containing protein [Erysipelotrichaceae bacterium]|nr:ACT domain-containing protein [Erysipelotrichaceae bacterium]
MRAVISVVGKDRPGILAFVATECAKRTINIVDVTQKVLQDLFTMIMIVEIPEDLENMHKIADEFDALGEEQGLRIHFMHEDIFNAMHNI